MTLMVDEHSGMGPAPSLVVVPATDDRATAGFFAAAAEGRLVVEQCRCGEVNSVPLGRCAACGSSEMSWRTVAGRGTIHSFTVVEHPVHPAFPVPYTIVLVELDDAPARFVGHLPGRADVEIGRPVHVRFERLQIGPVVVDVPRWDLV